MKQSRESGKSSASVADEPQLGRQFRRVVGSVDPEANPLRILNMGSCGIHNPQFGLNSEGRVPYLWSQFGFTVTPYALSSGATIQLFDFCTGELKLPLETRLLAYMDPNQPTGESRDALFGTDVILVELSTPIEFLLDGAIVNINRIAERVVAPLQKFIDKKLVARWASGLSQGDEAMRKSAADELLAQMPQEADESLTLLVKELHTRRLDTDDMVRDLSALRDRLPRPMGLVLYDFQYMPDGRPVEWPARFKRQQAEVAERLKLPTLDFAPLVEKLGTETTLESDLRHWKVEAYPIQAEKLYDFAAAQVGRLPLAQLPRRFPNFTGLGPQWQMASHESAEIAAIPPRLIAEMRAIHESRLAKLGVEESGLGHHYEQLLTRDAIFGRREEYAALLLIDHLPKFDLYTVMQAGLGQLAFALGLAGKRVVAHEVYPTRRAAISAGIEHFELLGLLKPGQVTVADGFPSRNCAEGSTIAVACELALSLGEEHEAQILRNLGALDGLLIEPRVFLGTHAPEDEQASVFDRLAAVGLSHAEKFSSLGLAYFCR